MASNLRVMLDQALGSGDDAGAVNFLELKVILDAILAKLDIGAELPQVGPNGEVKPATDKYHERLQQLERIVEGITRPKSPNTLIQQTQNGDQGPITKDFAENRLKKRVDANEEGIEKALDMLEKLARQLKNVESDLKDTKDRMASEQKTQDDHLSALDSLVKELESKMEENKAATDKVHDLSERLASLEERTAKVEQLSKEAVNWSQLDESFSHDFFGKNLDDEMSKCHEEREKYQNYFEGLHKLADMRDMIEDINSGLAELDKHVQTNINDMTKRQETSDSRIGDVNRRAEEIDGRVNDLLDENNRLRRDLEMFKTSTEKVGEDPNKAIIMKLHDEISNVADSLLDLRKRLRDEELKTEDHGMHLREHEETLDNHGNDLADLKNLRSELDNMSNLYESKFKEMAETRAALGDGLGRGNSEISNETVEKLQKQLSGTERELKAMEELLRSLSADGKAKSEELERLQRLLHDLQERAALKDFVTTSLDQKADASDLRALLSKDELDSTAQSIINQLQELINRQAAHEQSMGEHLKEVGQEVDHRTKDDDFNRFSEEIEKRLRALRKKIEKAGAGGLRDLATEAGAAGFRKQLFNCISCDKDLYMRITNPLLPSPSAFPARMSLRPHTAYDTKHVRAQARGDPSDLLDPIKRENTSDYNTLLVEKELERRRKMKENKIRQEISGYNFKSGSIPRQVGGNRQVIYDRGARQEELRHAMGTEYETADLEGVDGHLYKGRVKKLPNLVRKTLDEEDLNRSLDSPAPADVHTPPTAPEKS